MWLHLKWHQIDFNAIPTVALTCLREMKNEEIIVHLHHNDHHLHLKMSGLKE